MIPSKKKIAVLCGGRSAEHEVSIESAKNVIQCLDKNQYEVSVIFVARDGKWLLLDSVDTILNNPALQQLKEPFPAKPLLFQLGHAIPLVIHTDNALQPFEIDLIFPLLHGTYGEDGTLQGLLASANIPYVGSGVLGSAICMDKEVSKRLLQQADIPVAKWIAITRTDIPTLQFEAVKNELGLPLFVKPANAGSSIGVSKVKDEADFKAALALAQQYDTKILLETDIQGREIECAVLGNDDIQTSLPGEIILKTEFYSYEAKYLDPDGAILSTPAQLTPDLVEKIQALAKKAFVVLGCKGMARIDFFVTSGKDIFLNEANTLPGFTQISQYPYMWTVSGLAYSKLLDTLIHLAFQRNPNEHHGL